MQKPSGHGVLENVRKVMCCKNENRRCCVFQIIEIFLPWSRTSQSDSAPSARKPPLGLGFTTGTSNPLKLNKAMGNNAHVSPKPAPPAPGSWDRNTHCLPLLPVPPQPSVPCRDDVCKSDTLKDLWACPLIFISSVPAV